MESLIMNKEEKKSSTPALDELYITIRNSESLLYEGAIKAITSFNEKGKFDIIPMHTNFISIIQSKLSIYQMDGKIAEITFDNGILKVKGNKVSVFLGVDDLSKTIL